MKLTSIATLALCAAASFAPAAMADGAKPGSKLVYIVHRSGLGLFTIVSVTNTNTYPQNPNSFGGSTNVHFEYVNVVPNPANPFRPLDCIIFDRVEFLTPADTLSVLTTCHNAVAPGGQEGYLVVTAQDPSNFDCDWVHNDLVGSECVVAASGVVYSLEAVSLKAFGEKGQHMETTPHEPLECCDDVRYAGLPRVLIIDSFLAVGSSQLALISATKQHDHVRDVLFSVWNDNEFPLSATLRFNCWFDQPLVRISTLFSESFLRGTRHDADELDVTCDGRGDFESGWATIRTLAVSTVGGERVHNGDKGMLGAITAGPLTMIDGGRLLWEECRDI